MSLVKLGLLYRQGNDIPEANEMSVSDLCDDYGFRIICPKAADGDAWQSTFDTDPILRITGADRLREMKQAYRARNIDLAPWVVYRGRDWIAEATLHAEIANICGSVIVDFEWKYAGFADSGTFEDAVAYFAKLRELAPEATIVFCPDPRQVKYGSFDASQIWPHVSGYSPQQYWTDFQRDVLDVTDEALATCPEAMPYWPMMPGNGTGVDLGAAINRVSTMPNLGGVLIFQRVGLNTKARDILNAWAAPQNTP